VNPPCSKIVLSRLCCHPTLHRCNTMHEQHKQQTCSNCTLSAHQTHAKTHTKLKPKRTPNSNHACTNLEQNATTCGHFPTRGHFLQAGRATELVWDSSTARFHDLWRIMRNDNNEKSADVHVLGGVRAECLQAGARGLMSSENGTHIP
jgi:hypothetical protein